MLHFTELLSFIILWGIFSCDVARRKSGCRTLNFNISAANKRLSNHTVRTIRPITDIGSCRRQCFMEQRCSSINFCFKPSEDSWCELVDTDQTRHASDMQNTTGCTHLSTESACVSNPCVANATCSGDHLKDQVPYKCICPHGYEGLYCNKVVDECTNGNHDCHVYATCKNVDAIDGYNCTCNEGFYGNGRMCEDTDECSTGKHDCHVNATCKNAIGGYNCTCKDGFHGNVRVCEDEDECTTGKHDCHVNATCNNTIGGYSCTCKEGYHGNGKMCEGPFKDCAALQSAGITSSGAYQVKPDDKGFIHVYCDMISEGGGWTVISNRFDGSVNFNRSWTQYKTGFGDIKNGEFWLGNDNIHRLTAARPRSQLYVPLVNMAGSNFYAKYSTFAVANESDLYRLTVAGYYAGNARDSFVHSHPTWRSHNMMFSTPERDNDKCPCNCAAGSACGWWMNWCGAGRMTQYPMQWHSLRPSYEMREGSMKIKPYNE